MALRRIKHQPSPLGLRVHPSILLLPPNRANHCVPSCQSSPCLARRMEEASLPWGHRATCHRSCCHHEVTKLPGCAGPQGVLWQWGCSCNCEAEPAPHPMLVSGSSTSSSTLQSRRDQLPPLQKKLFGLSSPLPIQNRRERGLSGPPRQRHDQGKPFGWASRWCFNTGKTQHFHPSLEQELQKRNLVSKVIEKRNQNPEHFAHS